MRTAFMAAAMALAACAGPSNGAATSDTTPATNAPGTEPKGPGEHHGDHHGPGHHGPGGPGDRGHEGKGPPGEKHHPRLPPALAAYHEVLRPVWHSPPGQEREKRACDQGAVFVERAKAVTAEAPPPGVQADRWTAATQKLASTSASLRQGCDAAARVAIERRLDEMHTAFHELMETLPHPPPPPPSGGPPAPPPPPPGR